MDLDDLKLYVDTFTLDDNVQKEIIHLNPDEIRFCIELHELVRLSMVPEINEINTKEEEVVRAIFLQFSQAILSFKSTLLLSTYGYYTNSMINLRSLLETFFNVRYIVLADSKSERKKRAKEYIKYGRPRNDKGDPLSVSDKVKSSPFLIDQVYYNAFYSSLSQYTHANYVGVSQQSELDGIRTSPSSHKIDLVLGILSGVFHDLIEFMSTSLSLTETLNKLSTLEKPEHFLLLRFYLGEEIKKLKEKELKSK